MGLPTSVNLLDFRKSYSFCAVQDVKPLTTSLSDLGSFFNFSGKKDKLSLECNRFVYHQTRNGAKMD